MNVINPMAGRYSPRVTLDVLEKLVLVVLLGWLALRLVPQLANTPINVVYLGSETLAVGMVAFRRATTQISVKPADWLVSFVGTFLPLLVERSDRPGVALGGLFMLLGLGTTIGAYLSLRRSFGVVAANRGVQTDGIYGAVRHPMYLGYFLTLTGFLLTNPTVWNAAVYGVWVGCQFHRIRAEEQLLIADPAYVVFTHRVRYRLLPWIY